VTPTPPAITTTIALYRVQRRHGKAFATQPDAGPVRRPARVAVMLAFAHYIRAAIEDGRVVNQADAASRLGYTPARMSQLLGLLLLAPDLQERVLLMEAVDGAQPLYERLLRPVVRRVSWVEQRAAFEALGVGRPLPESSAQCPDGPTSPATEA
jgi:hypothetical protein